MAAPSDPSYCLIDPHPVAANAPYTFFLPSPAEIAAIAPGDLVKLIFEYPHETETWGAERMWVNVSEVTADAVAGTLENQPSEPTARLTMGDPIAFQHRHIIAILWDKPDQAPAPEPYREYWERCLVDDCVLDGSQPVEYLYREEPDLAKAGDEHPDSGWRIRGRMGDTSDEDMDDRKICYVAIGAVLNRDDSWLNLIDAPIGASFFRDFTTDRYDPC